MNLPAFMRELFYSELDYHFYVSQNPFWFDVYRELYKSYFPFERKKEDCSPCSCVSLIDNQTAARNYKSLWSEMVACDILSSVNFKDEKSVKMFCEKFKELYLANDGSNSQLEIFTKFTGRSFPKVGPLIESWMLDPQSSN
ncbi:unnamed protein product [Soboliphyme baturini]|uniref:Peptidase_M3 domain-containing protein n=1 Tax=Soboliphyme baturini TaxID=241478 RepID=A0A183IUH6_9BILA|nr:unnamed protein product [Soboliphyme baturini]